MIIEPDDAAMRVMAIRLLVNELDPIGLLASGAPEDEYEPEVGALAELEVPVRPRDVIDVFVHWFGSTGELVNETAEHMANGINVLQDQPRFVKASIEELREVVGVLDDAAERLHVLGIRQWPRRFDPASLRPAIEAGETWLVRVEDRVAGTVTIDADDPIWGDRPAVALYVHRLAARRGYPGLGRTILDWAELRGRLSGVEAIRLDCVSSNSALINYYLGRGFSPCGEMVVGGSPGQRDGGSAQQTPVMRMEKTLHR